MKLLLCLVFLLFLSTSCTHLQPKSDKINFNTKEVYPIAARQTAPDKTYYDQTNVLSPEPDYNLNRVARDSSSRKVLLPNFHYDLGQANLCEAAKALASSIRFSSYCVSGLKKQVLNISVIKTPIEFKDYLEANANVKIVIDSANNEVRFFVREK